MASMQGRVRPSAHSQATHASRAVVPNCKEHPAKNKHS
jgi:hypothetical protein